MEKSWSRRLSGSRRGAARAGEPRFDVCVGEATGEGGCGRTNGRGATVVVVQAALRFAGRQRPRCCGLRRLALGAMRANPARRRASSSQRDSWGRMAGIIELP